MNLSGERALTLSASHEELMGVPKTEVVFLHPFLACSLVQRREDASHNID